MSLASIAPAAATNPPPGAEKPVESAAALAGLEAVITANPVVDYPAVIIDECPFGAQVDLATSVNDVVPIDAGVVDGDTHAWVNPDLDQPGAGCWISVDEETPHGIYWVEAYGRALRDLPYAGVTWGDQWERVDESAEPLRNGELHTLCLISTESYAVGERICIAHWVDAEVGLLLELELWTNDGSVTAADAGTAMKSLLPTLATALAANA